MARSKIISNFSKNVEMYNEKAIIQKKTAQLLLDNIVNEYPRRPSNILEIGCGTGFLTDIISKKYYSAHCVANDISEQMIDFCKLNISQQNISYEKFDAEDITDQNKFDLVCSNLAFQWFNNFEVTLKKLWNISNKSLAFTTLGKNTFTNWQRICKQNGSNAGLMSLPSHNELLLMLNNFSGAKRIIVNSISFEEEFDSTFDFLKNMKEIGINTPKDGYQKLTPNKIRKVLDKSFTANYEILFCYVEK